MHECVSECLSVQGRHYMCLFKLCGWRPYDLGVKFSGGVMTPGLSSLSLTGITRKIGRALNAVGTPLSPSEAGTSRSS